MAKHCTNCGHELRDGDKFCANCGAPSTQDTSPGSQAASVSQQFASPTTTARANRDPSAAVSCPIDGASGAVQKVSAVVSGGSWSGSVGGWSSEAQTALSTRLTLPPPTYIKPLRMFRLELFAFWFYCVAYVASVGVSTYMLVAGDYDHTAPMSPILASVLAYLIFLTIPIYQYLRVRRGRRIAKANETAMAQWRREREVWEQLYYCHRHDVVFLPGGSPVPADNMRQLLVS